MNLFKWWSGRFTERGRAVKLYRSGMDRAKKRDTDGAIRDYTDAIRLSNDLPDVCAMALYNRALMYLAAEDAKKATADLKTVLNMAKAPNDIKIEAKQRLTRMKTKARMSSE